MTLAQRPGASGQVGPSRPSRQPSEAKRAVKASPTGPAAGRRAAVALTAGAAKLPPQARRCLKSWPPALRVWVALHAAALAVALAVALAPGAAPLGRRLLALNTHPTHGDLVAAVAIFAHNLAVLAPLLLGPQLRSRLGAAHWTLRAYKTWVIAWAVITVGAALGAYGPALLGQLAHVPVEWAALAVAATQSASPKAQSVAAPAVGALLAAAALLETRA